MNATTYAPRSLHALFVAFALWASPGAALAEDGPGAGGGYGPLALTDDGPGAGGGYGTVTAVLLA
ncbi:MAG: hypothetical protein R2939_08355 [Kofleriaceae bacterium]